MSTVSEASRGNASESSATPSPSSSVSILLTIPSESVSKSTIPDSETGVGELAPLWIIEKVFENSPSSSEAPSATIGEHTDSPPLMTWLSPFQLKPVSRVESYRSIGKTESFFKHSCTDLLLGFITSPKSKDEEVNFNDGILDAPGRAAA